MNKKHIYTKEMLEPLVKESFSFGEVTRKLGLRSSTGSQTHITKRIQEFNIDTSHFLGKAWNKGKIFHPKRDISDYLTNKISIKSHVLLKRLIKENYKKHICEYCQKIKWFDKLIPLELHHKNCNHLDNRLTNLQLLCPTCHTYIHQYILT
jgi:hypothetical protein